MTKRGLKWMLAVLLFCGPAIASAQQFSKDALYSAAYNYQREYKPVEAVKCLRTLLKMDSTFVPAYNLLGYIYEDAFVNYDSALICYKKAIEIDSSYAKAYVNVGHIHFLRKEYQDALYWNEKAVEADSNYADAYFNIGWIYNGRRELGQSLHYIKKAASKGSAAAREWMLKSGYELPPIETKEEE